jgi:hypothetical protein
MCSEIDKQLQTIAKKRLEQAKLHGALLRSIRIKSIWPKCVYPITLRYRVLNRTALKRGGELDARLEDSTGEILALSADEFAYITQGKANGI